MATMGGVLVLNADLGPLHRVTIKHAIRMLLREVAVVHESEPDRLIGVYPMPKVLRLVQYVVTRWRFDGPGWSKTGVLRRDHYRCGYCGKTAKTVDHIVPRSRDGRNTWTNTVAACGSCNQRKANLTPEEAGMRLMVAPGTPTWR
jgi:5-methylcytosine-specific restriction endonuclease McrA